MQSFQNLCDQYGSIMRGKTEIKDGICFVTFPRNLMISVQGRISNSPLVNNVVLSFDEPNGKGNSINEVNIPLLHHEITPIIAMAKQEGIDVGAVHNHWLYVQPPILNVHLQKVEKPLLFAQKMQNIVSYLRGGFSNVNSGTL